MVIEEIGGLTVIEETEGNLVVNPGETGGTQAENLGDIVGKQAESLVEIEETLAEILGEIVESLVESLVEIGETGGIVEVAPEEIAGMKDLIHHFVVEMVELEGKEDWPLDFEGMTAFRYLGVVKTVSQNLAGLILVEN